MEAITTIWYNVVKSKLPLKHSDNENPSKSYPYSFPSNIQNFVLVWLDANIDKVNNNDCRNTIKQLQQVVHTVNTFIDVNQCIDFITDIKDKKVFMITSGSLGEIVMPIIHDMFQIDSIYIFCQDESRHKQWAQNWLKIKGVFTKISSICEELKQAAQQCDQNTIPISFISIDEQLSNQSLNQINQSFMYTQILKEILLKIEFDEQSMKDFIIYCREQFADNPIELNNINRLEQEYDKNKSIWWYTYECFLYSMLNRALRMMEVDTIIKMGFFIRNLHENIQRLHFEQYNDHRCSFKVYRGQGLSKREFNQLKKTKGGLLSFNNLLSTSKKPNVALNFARRSVLNSDLIGVVFVMKIDTSLSSTPFASIENVSHYQTEREVLFSMHSVFRINCIKQIDPDNDRLWRVKLELTSDNDPQRQDLTERIRRETEEFTGWHRLGKFLIAVGQYIKAEDLYKTLLDKPNEEAEKAQFYHHLGVIKDGQGEYEMAIHFYEKSLEINNQILSPDHHFLASSYTGIGLAYLKIGDYSKALSSLETALEIFQKALALNHPLIAKTYGNIGKVYHEMGEYSKAIFCHQSTLTIFKKTLLSTDPSMAICYYDIGKVYDKMGEISEALSAHAKALKIRYETLPSDHPLLAASYNSVGELYVKMGDYLKGLPYIQRAVDIGQRSLPANHPDLEHYKNNLKSLPMIF
jgi:tetratricopeptide (TPR) repeat protein